MVTCQRADGHEVSLAEFSLAQQLISAETVRAEEIALSVPDGRGVKTLINATLIRSADGEVESVVVTLQDLAPLDEIERMRAEFLGMVSHELRAPLTSIKGSTATVLGASAAVDRAEMLQFFRIPTSKPTTCVDWWTGPGTRSSTAAAATPCASTCPRTCRA